VVAACVADSVTVPVPVIVSVVPEIVAGPETTLYVTAPVEAEVALTGGGTFPYVCSGIGVKARDGVAGRTTNDVVAFAGAR